tara:strand:+ start:335 stop:1096 length:762 start_codon:yes stop_codon:yes gene_type:complete
MDEERHASIVAMLEGREVESEEEPEEFESQSVEEESEASDELEEEEEETSVEAAADDDDDEYEPEEGHRVPYDRFKQINERRHALQSELEQREQHIADLERRLSQKPEPPRQESTYDENDLSILDGDQTDDLTYLRQQTQEMQVKFATMELEREVGIATQEYPNVPEEYIWDALAQDGTQNASNVAARYSHWVAGVEEAAIARYLQEQSGGEVADAPPRPSRKQKSKSSSRDEEWRPRNTDEAREAMIEYLRS